jgi:alpha-glucosidase
MRVMTRWGGDNPPEDLAKVLIALLTSLRGSVCIYQGEELGLTEADIPFERLQDPYGIAFWPEFKGRDGCRTPMPWMAQEKFGRFLQASSHGCHSLENTGNVPSTSRNRAKARC